MIDKTQLRELFLRASEDTGGDARLELFRALDGVELYHLAEEVEVDGRPMWSTPLRTLNDGSRALMVYSSRVHPDLSSAFVGSLWSQVLAVAYEALPADWLVIVNRDDATVAIARDQIPVIRAALSEPNADSAAMAEPTGAEPTEAEPTGAEPMKPEQPADDLETTIADSVNAGSDRWYDRALEQLRGRELFLHLTEEVSATGQPTIQTSAEAGREGWILTYTTRDRPGITYGGIRWEELVAMIKRDDDAPGVRIVNRTDDWILLGRDVI